ncbi:MAG: hypothetical protein NC420_00475 [Eubacterium sp.]|nr:hypothetical protein [Eubacterium sp.]
MDTMNNAKKYSAIIVWIVVYFLMASIMIGAFARQILVKRLGLDNYFIREIIFNGNSNYMSNETYNAIDWSQQYPFGDENFEDARASRQGVPYLINMENRVRSVESVINTYCSEFLFKRDDLVTFSKGFNRIIGMRDIDNVEFLLNDHLIKTTGKVNNEDMSEIVSSVDRLNGYCRDRGIPFIYVNACSKVDPFNKPADLVGEDYSNENGNILVRNLQELGIDVINADNIIRKLDSEWYSCYYITDDHWKVETALAVSDALAEHMHSTYGFDYDAEYFDLQNYEVDLRESYFLGGYGRSVTLANTELEDFVRLFPKFDTSFIVEVPSRGITVKGDFVDAFFDNESFGDIGSYRQNEFLSNQDAYGAVTIKNDDYAEIHNVSGTATNMKTALVLQDSFGFYVTPFLANDFEDIYVIHPASFNGSIESFIAQENPDMVILMYSVSNIKGIDWSGHSSAFDFR